MGSSRTNVILGLDPRISGHHRTNVILGPDPRISGRRRTNVKPEDDGAPLDLPANDATTAPRAKGAA